MDSGSSDPAKSPAARHPAFKAQAIHRSSAQIEQLQRHCHLLPVSLLQVDQAFADQIDNNAWRAPPYPTVPIRAIPRNLERDAESWAALDVAWMHCQAQGAVVAVRVQPLSSPSKFSE